MAPLTGIALAINWLIDKLNLKIRVVKTTRMTTFRWLAYSNISEAPTYSRRKYD